MYWLTAPGISRVATVRMHVPGGAKGVDEAVGKGEAASQPDNGHPETEGETFYDAMKQEATERMQRTKAALAALPKAQRIALEGHVPGTYLRLLLTGAALSGTVWVDVLEERGDIATATGAAGCAWSFCCLSCLSSAGVREACSEHVTARASICIASHEA